jgi:predicted SPOUT superfamily RNA methylase MTH1
MCDACDACTNRHLMLVFGGVAGLEDVVGNDPDLRSKDTQALFDMYLNVCPNQGSNTIRTEEAMLVTLSALRPMLVRLHK